jgi:hypothetical protein
LTLFQKTIKWILKIDIGSKGNTNAIAEDNFNLRTGYSALGFTKQEFLATLLTQFNYSSLQLKGYSPIASSFDIRRKII